MDGIYTRQSSGYQQVITSDASSKHQGGNCNFLVRFSALAGRVGAYIPPLNIVTLEYMSKDLEARPEGVNPILVGDLNAILANLALVREGEIAGTLAARGLEDIMLSHFRPPRCPY
eukprot:scaffold34928_cov54-Attheya_sp.AAC.9